MKTAILLLAGTLTFYSSGKAQGVNTKIAASPDQARQNLTAEERAKRDAERAAIKLGLNDDQKSKWQTASLERITANEPLKNQIKTTTDKATKKQLSRTLRENTQKFDNNVNGFLTDDQKVKWEQLKKERKEKRLKQAPEAPKVTN